MAGICQDRPPSALVARPLGSFEVRRWTQATVRSVRYAGETIKVSQVGGGAARALGPPFVGPAARTAAAATIRALRDDAGATARPPP
jgi:hypothetical protein